MKTTTTKSGQSEECTVLKMSELGKWTNKGSIEDNTIILQFNVSQMIALSNAVEGHIAQLSTLENSKQKREGLMEAMRLYKVLKAREEMW